MPLIIIVLIIFLAAMAVAVMKILGRWKGSPAGEDHPALGKMVNGIFYLLLLLILLILITWYLGLYGHGKFMEAHPGWRSNLGIVMIPAFFFLGYISLFLLWAMILAVTSESVKPLSLKIQSLLIFLLAVIPSVFVLVISLPGIKDAFKKYEYIDDLSPVEEEVFQGE